MDPIKKYEENLRTVVRVLNECRRLANEVGGPGSRKPALHMLRSLNRRKKIAASNPAKAVSFAKVVLQKRWKEAEEVVLSDPCEAARYAEEVLEGRWVDAEPVIATDPVAAANYAVNVLKERWKEAEEVIARNHGAASVYGKHVVKRWDPEMAKLSPVWLYMYADLVSCGKLPLSLHNRMLMWSFDDTMKNNGYVRSYFAGKKFRRR